MKEKDQARFWAKVALPNANGCMLWLGRPTPADYGQFWLDGRYLGAHRVSYVLAYGEIPEGLQVDHVKARGCVSTMCVAPEHLEAVTQRENIRRGAAGRGPNRAPLLWNARKTHCPQGHPYAGDNLYAHKGYRYCRTCRKAAR